MYNKPLIFVVISVLVVALVYSSSSVSAAVTRGPKECTLEDEGIRLQCCQTETDDEGIEIRWCTDCRVKAGVGYSSCGPRYQALEASTPTPGDTGVFEQPLTPPPGPAAPLQDGGVLQQPPSEGVAPPPTRGQGVLPEESIIEQERPGAVEPPVDELQCPEGQVIDEETGLCVLEEAEAAEDPAQSEPEEEQPSEESGSDNDNN